MTLESHSTAISENSSRPPVMGSCQSNLLKSARIRSNDNQGRSAVPKKMMPPAACRNPAFQSKLEPHRAFIRECRSKRWSYPRIAAALREQFGLSASPSTIFNFVKVRARRRSVYTLPDDLPVSPSVPADLDGQSFFTPPQPIKSHEHKLRKLNLNNL